MWTLLAAYAQDCVVSTAVAGFPLGTVPTNAQSVVVLESACPLQAEVAIYDGDEPIHLASLQPEREGDFQLFTFQVAQPPLAVDLFFDLAITIDGEIVRYVGGWYLVDDALEETLVGTPQLADLRTEHRGDHLVATAAVYPATTAPEALFLWRVDGELQQVGVSTRPRPELVLPADRDEVCIEVEEIGVDGTRVRSEPRCIDTHQPSGCGCTNGRARLVGWGLRR